MDRYNVYGMSCAACSARVEKAVSKVSGVDKCAVNLLTNSMTVEGTAEANTILEAVEKAGYSAELTDGNENNGYNDGSQNTFNSSKSNSNNSNKEIKSTRNRLISSIILLLPLMYVSMGCMMWNWPMPGFLKDNIIGIGLYEMLFAIIVMIINQKFFISGFKAVINLAPNMDTLVALGSSASFIYSTIVLFEITYFASHDKAYKINALRHDFYFESAAMILTLITVGKLLETISKGRTKNALEALKNLAPETATVIRDEKEIKIHIKNVIVGDKFIVKSGDSIPVDGVVIEGNGAVDESAITGESMPVDKFKNDNVYSATINQNGYMVCKATRVGNDTTLSQIINMVSDASASKAPIAKIADKVSGIFVPTVISISLVTLIVWLCIGKSVGFSIARAISVLVISCPCALGLATPVAIMVGNGVGARNKVLFKNAEALENTGKIKIVAVDKTGTITKGNLEVTDVMTLAGTSDGALARVSYITLDKTSDVTLDKTLDVASDKSSRNLLEIAFLLESRSEHPVAKALVNYVNSLFEAGKLEKLPDNKVDEFKVIPGRGVEGIIDSKKYYCGNSKYINEIINLKSQWLEKISVFEKQGKTPVFVASDDKFYGTIFLADVIKEDSREAIEELKNMGIKVVMLTGDNKNTAEFIGKSVGVDQVIAGVLPWEKEKSVKELMSHGKTAMIGDGINDAPALTVADIGIAIGAGTDIAIDSADVILMRSSLMDVSIAIKISRKTLKNIKENLFWAFFYNAIGIPIAAGVFIFAGLKLNPMLGAAAMSLSSFCVVTNALRLNLFKAKKHKDNEELNKFNGKDSKTDEFNAGGLKTDATDEMHEIIVKGMMCEHCEKRIVNLMNGIDGISDAKADFKTGKVTFVLEGELDKNLVKKLVKEEGYKVKKI